MPALQGCLREGGFPVSAIKLRHGESVKTDGIADVGGDGGCGKDGE